MATNNLDVQHPGSSDSSMVISNGKDFLSTLPAELILMIGRLACSPPFFKVPSSRDDSLPLPVSERCRLLVLTALCRTSNHFNYIFKPELYTECYFFDTGSNIFSLIPQRFIVLHSFRRITLRRAQVKGISTELGDLNPFIEPSMFSCLYEFTFTGDFGRYMGYKSDRYYDPIKLSSKCFPCLSSMRFINVSNGELLIIFLFDIAPIITSLEIRPSAYDPRRYNCMISTFRPLLQRFHALKSLTISHPRSSPGNAILCDDVGRFLNTICCTLPNMRLIQALMIAIPSFHCKDIRYPYDHPDFWKILLRFVSACNSLQYLSFGGDPVPDVVKKELRSSSSSTNFAVTRFENVYQRSKYIPRSILCWLDPDLDQNTDSDNEIDGAIGDDDMDSFILENQSVEYESDDSEDDD